MKTYFHPTDAHFRIELALAVNRIAMHNNRLLVSETDSEIIASVVADVAKLNDIVVNFIGFGGISNAEVEWITEAHSRNELWHSEKQKPAWLALWESVKSSEGN